MRLWSLHPQYLDTKGLSALWREGLLAQKVLQGKTRGYRNHPQLERFKEQDSPLKAIGNYLKGVWQEADQRGYAFQKQKVKNSGTKIRPISVSRGQTAFEWEHLKKKLKKRDMIRFKKFQKITKPKLHPSFRSVTGPIASWEKV